MQNSALIEKIQNLPLEIVNEVEDFVDFLTEKQRKGNPDNSENSETESVNLQERGISPEEAAAQRAALSSFAEDWEHPGMDVYDKL
jgi:hypothetical protein